MTDSPTASAFRFGDLLDHDELRLKLLTGGPETRSRRVAGAHAIEIERPTAWLEPEGIMLTTCARLRRSARAQRELVAELQTAGAAGRSFRGGAGFWPGRAARIRRRGGLPARPDRPARRGARTGLPAVQRAARDAVPRCRQHDQPRA